MYLCYHMTAQVFAVLLLLATPFATEVQGVPTVRKHYQNTFEVLLTRKGLEVNDIAFKDCCEIGRTARLLNVFDAKQSGIYDISDPCPNTHLSFRQPHPSPIVLPARCDMTTDDGGWLVILRRNADVSPWVNFSRRWIDYENGFGNLNTEFWYGLKNIHCLTQRDDVELMIELKQNGGTGVTLTFQEFRVGGPKTNYILNVGQGTGSGHQRISYNNGQAFTTYNRDNDNNGGNCAAYYGGGWWFDNCGSTRLTNPHDGYGRIEDNHKPAWFDGSQWVIYSHIEMKVRPKSCRL